MSGHYSTILPSESLFTQVDSTLANIFAAIYSNPMEMNIIFALITAGLYYTIKSKAVQIRLFPAAVKAVLGSRQDSNGGISSFQAFAIGIASRVGTGNIAGVAIAIVAGGPGAIFWMWVIAFLGMATGFMEAVLAQLFKVRGPDNTFRGGPAYYIRDGLGSKGWGATFAIFLIFAFGFAFEMVQANTIANVAHAHFGYEPWIVALGLIILSAPIIFGGLRPVARIAELMAPAMALAYLLLAGAVLVLNFTEIPAVLALIVKSAFGFDQVVGGSAGAFFAALTNGTKRGLFSNEAGMGSAPNAAATATIKHPVQQGLIQSLGVFVDTILVCTATACIVLFSGLYHPGQSINDGAALTVESLQHSLGDWVGTPMVIIIFVFAYSSILGNYTYAEINWNFLRGMKASQLPLKAMVLVAIGLGAVMSLSSAWNLADIATAFMALLNIFSLFLLSKYALGALKDWESQLKQKPGEVPVFKVTDNEFFPQGLPGDIWK
ncbi:amino acid carrier protein [Gleimia coleocanis DSM 15436]|uniref:Amino acid carrier protein n=1 Tax=Gleimia coleocanis DSM 15436 TaxID=525245 RepID=C0W151_9ACTO|nr:alanine/glycine:cation symporter family protein [Gleimia coleocanis]EEH63540.1 amino acid carrier protein [Gleimia coleocanis DSM 15436]